MRALAIGVVMGAALAGAAGLAQAGEKSWTTGTMVDGTVYAEYTLGKKSITLYCRGGVHEFIYGMPVAEVGEDIAKRKIVDLVLIVDNEGSDYDYISAATAWVETYANMISFHLERRPAADYQSAAAGGDTLTIGIAKEYRYTTATPEMIGVQTYELGDGAAERAAMSVLGPCVPKKGEPNYWGTE